MRLSTSILPPSDDCRIESGTTAVVIDVLRATSVMTTALAHGAEQIITCREVDTAKRLGQTLDNALLCGERRGVRIDGFDLGNSPDEYASPLVQGKTVVLTTTNGTRAIDSVADCDRVLAASFLNLSAVTLTLEGAQSVRLICSGTEGAVTEEDVLLAGAIAHQCETRYGAVTTDEDTRDALQNWHSGGQRVHEILRASRGGRNLLSLGFDKDVERCARIDELRTVPRRLARDPMTFVG